QCAAHAVGGDRSTGRLRNDRRQRSSRSNINASRLESDLVGIVGNLDQIEVAPDLHIAVGSVSAPVRNSLDPLLAEGRGLNAHEARSSCLGEAAERYSCLFRGNETRLLSTY